MKTAKIPYFLHDKPLFGLDIGHGSLKVMQVSEVPAKAASHRAAAAPERLANEGYVFMLVEHCKAFIINYLSERPKACSTPLDPDSAVAS